VSRTARNELVHAVAAGVLVQVELLRRRTGDRETNRVMEASPWRLEQATSSQWENSYVRFAIRFPTSRHRGLQLWRRFGDRRHDVGRTTRDRSTRPTGIRAGRCARPPTPSRRGIPCTFRTARLHRLGYLSGVYSGASSGIVDLVNTYTFTTFARPEQVWFARWDGVAETADAVIPAPYWSGHQRIK
jgi:hypothetical protein